MCNKKALSNIAGRQFQPHLMKEDSLQEICHSLEASVRVVREASPVLAIASELVQQQERIQVTQLWPAYRPSHSCPFQIEIIIENQSWSIQLKLYLCPRSAICFPPPEQFVSSYVGSWSNKISFEYTSLCVSTRLIRLYMNTAIELLNPINQVIFYRLHYRFVSSVRGEG